MKPAILPMIITLSLSACGNLTPSRDFLRNPAVDAEYRSNQPKDAGADEDKPRSNLEHAGYRFGSAISRALQYRDVVPLNFEQSLQYWTEQVTSREAELAKVKGLPQEALVNALLEESKRNKDELAALKNTSSGQLTTLKQASSTQLAALQGNGLLAVPRYQALKEMWQAGVSYADLNCANYFDLASRQQTTRDFLAKEVQLLAGLTSAVQGLTGVSAKVISATASSFSFGQSAMSTYETTMALSPDIYLLQKAVQLKKRNQRKLLDNPALFAGSYYDVEQALLAYAEPCTFTGLKSIINEALQEKNQKDKGPE